jgi:ESCRT-I complex subunit VPS37
MQRFDMKPQLARLRTATSDHDHLSESLASSFQDGDMEEDEFARQYLEVRRIYHRRALQVQKMCDGKVIWRD